jgi:hypothetical protein
MTTLQTTTNFINKNITLKFFTTNTGKFNKSTKQTHNSNINTVNMVLASILSETNIDNTTIEVNISFSSEIYVNIPSMNIICALQNLRQYLAY